MEDNDCWNELQGKPDRLKERLTARPSFIALTVAVTATVTSEPSGQLNNQRCEFIKRNAPPSVSVSLVRCLRGTSVAPPFVDCYEQAELSSLPWLFRFIFTFRIECKKITNQSDSPERSIPAGSASKLADVWQRYSVSVS